MRIYSGVWKVFIYICIKYSNKILIINTEKKIIKIDEKSFFGLFTKFLFEKNKANG